MSPAAASPPAGGWPFRRVLIANRGEIALRIVRTVQALGLEAVVVYHAADAAAPGVLAADRAIEITGPTPVAAYLDGAQIIAAARASGAGAIHPGYGFLSENAGFARQVADAGLVFVGPGADAIELMGDKVRARDFVAARGFPVAPSAIEDDDPVTFTERARAIGFPLLIKPAAGGGGKGMRIVREAAGAGGRDRARPQRGRPLFRRRPALCRAIRRAAAPHRGAGAGRRARQRAFICSSASARYSAAFRRSSRRRRRRRLTSEQRRRICETAVGIARAAGYRNAGTIEFIYGKRRVLFPRNEHAPAGRASGDGDGDRDRPRGRTASRRRRRTASLHAVGGADRRACHRIPDLCRKPRARVCSDNRADRQNGDGRTIRACASIAACRRARR